ncbi:helix-turn-helix transcriptional regulator [Microbacterium deminutum]|uniref:LuxR family transcriptional regulator n=1 Tax=Microbacterium deminutum TaxID=344164 RepID=A0ABP5BUL8_9MICO
MSGFVGRRAELDRLADCAAAVEAGSSKLVFIEGPAGIGKTSLLAAVGDHLAGFRRLEASCEETEARLPFGLVTRLIARARRDSSGSPPLEPGDADPFQVGAQLLQVLSDLQVAHPVAVILDDAPWADPQSLRALSFALRRLDADRVLTVLTMREADVARLPPELVRHAHRATRLRLQGLDTQEVRELAAEMGQPGLPRRAAERLQEHTGGNPLHLRSLFEELVGDDLRWTGHSLPAPASFDRIVAAAMTSCPESGRRLITAAAVLGVRAPLSEAAAVGEVGEPAGPLGALEEAASTPLVRTAQSAEGWLIAFRHPLIRAAVYADIGPATRARLHARAAEVVAEPEALAHRVAAASETDSALVGQLVAQAGRDELMAMPALAADRLLDAVRLSEPGPARDDLLLEAVELLLRAGEANEAATYTDRVAAIPASGRRHLVQAQLAWMSGAREAAPLARSSWKQAGSPIEAASAAVLLAQLQILRGKVVPAARWAQRALDVGELPAPLASAARLNLAVALGLSGRPHEGIAVLAAAPDDAGSMPAWREDERWVRGGLRLWTDDVTGALADLQQPAREGTGPAVRPYGLIRLGYLAQSEYRTGAWDDSADHAERVVSLVADTDQIWLLAFAHAVASFVPAARGQWDEARRHLHAAATAAATLEDEGSVCYAANAAVHFAGFRGDWRAVVAAAEPLLRSGATGAREPGVFAWAGEYAAALVGLRRLDEAQAVLNELAHTAERRGLRSTSAVVARVRGELAAARSDPGGAARLFETAIELARPGSDMLEEARTRMTYGHFLVTIGDPSKAAEQLRFARDVLYHLRAAPFLKRCDDDLAACDHLQVTSTRMAPGAERPAETDSLCNGSLTPQERAVARLVCAGLTNREVAAELVISVKTVGYHLEHAYTKLGVHSRTQLAVALGRQAR